VLYFTKRLNTDTTRYPVLNPFSYSMPLKGDDDMSYSVIHMQKMKIGAVRGIENHNERKTESRTNPDIDKGRSHLNKDMMPPDDRTYHRRIKERIAELNLPRAVRKDAVVACGFICTSDRKFFEGLNQAEQDRFFKGSHDFLKDRYGEKNVIASKVHYDETTPHLHTYIVPVTEDGRLSAKSLFTRKELKELQTDYHRHMNDLGFDLERGESTTKHLSTQEFKLQTKRQQLEKVEEALTAQEIKLENKQQKLEQLDEAITTQESKLSAKQRELWEVESDLADREAKINTLEKAISNQEGTLQIKREELQKAEEAFGALQSDLKSLESEYKRVEGIKAQFYDIEAVEARTGLLRRSEVRMSPEDFDMLKSLAKKAPILESRVNTLEGQNKRLNSDLLEMNKMLEDLKSERAKFKKIYDEGLGKNKNMKKIIDKMNRVIKENPVLGNEFVEKFTELVEEEKIAEQAKAEEAMEKEPPSLKQEPDGLEL